VERTAPRHSEGSAPPTGLSLVASTVVAPGSGFPKSISQPFSALPSQSTQSGSHSATTHVPLSHRSEAACDSAHGLHVPEPHPKAGSSGPTQAPPHTFLPPSHPPSAAPDTPADPALAPAASPAPAPPVPGLVCPPPPSDVAPAPPPAPRTGAGSAIVTKHPGAPANELTESATRSDPLCRHLGDMRPKYSIGEPIMHRGSPRREAASTVRESAAPVIGAIAQVAPR
jgi:hypothetical protein